MGILSFISIQKGDLQFLSLALVNCVIIKLKKTKMKFLSIELKSIK